MVSPSTSVPDKVIVVEVSSLVEALTALVVGASFTAAIFIVMLTLTL